MIAWRKIFDFYIKSSLHVAFAIFSFVKVTVLSLNISTDVFFEATVFFGSVIGYNFLKYDGFWLSKKFDFQKIKNIFGVTILAFLFFLFCFFQLGITKQFAFIKIAVIVLCYPFLRKYGFLKIAVVSFCVTFVVSYMPTLDLQIILISYRFFQLKLFFLICALMIPFEIFDSQFDAFTLQTIPQKFGLRNAKITGYLFLIIFCVFGFFNNLLFKILMDILISIIVGFFIYYASIKNSKYYTSFWVESIPIFWWILVLLLR